MTRITRDWTAKNSNKVVRRNGGNSPASQMGAVSLAQKPSISEKSPARKLNPCHSGSGTKCRKHGQHFLRLGQPKGGGPELIRTETQICVGPRRTLGSRHFHSSTHEISEIETKASAGFSHIEGSDKGI